MIKTLLIIVVAVILYLVIGLITTYFVSYLDTRFNNIPFTDGVDYDECIGIGFLWPLAYPVLAILYIAHLYIYVAKAAFKHAGRMRRK